MTGPGDIEDSDNWTGSYYELALELGERDDGRLEASLKAVWAAANVRGCFAQPEPKKTVRVDCSLANITRYGNLRGTVTLPSGHDIVCGVVVVREEVAAGFYGPDWLDFYLPTNALGRIDDRVVQSQSGELDDSLAWRQSIDDWLARVARSVFDAAPFKLGLIGEEASGMAYSDRLSNGVPVERYYGYLLPHNRELTYYAATR